MKRCFSLALICCLLVCLLADSALSEVLDVIDEFQTADPEEVTEIVGSELPVSNVALMPDEAYEESIEAAAPLSTAADESGTDEAETPAESDPESSAETDPEASEAAYPVATSIKFNTKSLSVGVGEKVQGKTLIAVADGFSMPVLRWRSANAKIAKVNAKTGVIKALKKGTVTVYAKIKGKKKEVKCTIRVKKAPKKGKVKLSPASLSLSAGMTQPLTVSFSGGFASASLTFKSSKPAIAAVDKNGVITALAAGKATITVKTYNGVTAKCSLKVLAEPAYVAFPESTMPLNAGESASLGAQAMTADDTVTLSDISYSIDESSPDAGCVVLDEASGTVLGVRQGQAVIRATAYNGAVGNCLVAVDGGPAAMTLSATSLSLGVKEVYDKMTVALTPHGDAAYCDETLTWVSSNPKIAKVDAATGNITALATGKCTIRATAVNGLYAECRVNVLKAPKKGKLSVTPKNGALKVGQSGQYAIKFASGYGGGLTFKSSNPDVAVIDSTGIVTAVASGTTAITVTTYNGVKVKVTLEVTGSTSDAPSLEGTDGEKIQYLIKLGLQKKGAPYVYGSFGPNSFDCSGFTYWLFKQVKIKLKDSAYKQGYDDRYPQIEYADLREGDLVFFNTVEDSDLSDHAGLYVGSGYFVHASSSAGKVIVSKLSSGYYRRNFSWGRRVFN